VRCELLILCFWVYAPHIILVQTFIKPLELDTKVLKLMDDVEGTLRLVLEADTGEEAKVLTDRQRNLLPQLLCQANECMLFVQEYTSQSYCESGVSASFLIFTCVVVGTVAKALVKNYDGIIADYVAALRSLKDHFRDSQLWSTQVVVHRLETTLVKIGESCHSA